MLWFWQPDLYGRSPRAVWKHSECMKVPLFSTSVKFHLHLVRSVQFSSIAQLCPTLRNTMYCSTPGLPVHHQLLEFIQTYIHWVSDAIQPSHPLSSPLRPSIFPSIRVFSNESVLRFGWPKYLSFSFSISPSSEYSGLFSFRMVWLDLHAVQGTLNSLLQYHSLKHQFFGAQLSLWSLTSIRDYWNSFD